MAKNTSAEFSRQVFPRRLARYYDGVSHGDYHDWLDAVAGLPGITPTSISLDGDVVRIGRPEDCSAAQRAALRRQLQRLLPWRKGPFNLFGLEIDAEWRSDMKWRRLQDTVTPLNGRTVLDVGCGNGYYGWRMLGAGAERVVGTDPTLRYVMQQRAVAKYLPHAPFDILPFTLETLAAGESASIPAQAASIPAQAASIPAQATAIPAQATSIPAQATSIPAQATVIPAQATVIPAQATVIPAQAGTHLAHPLLPPGGFDSVFSMGVIYHRRDPVRHIHDLLRFLRPGGELVLESLVIDNEHGDVLQPRGRYARMRNIWSIPSIATLEDWLSGAGLTCIRIADVSVTTPAEQRVTKWTFEQSLSDFLDPQNTQLTIEGYPAPKRAIVICNW